MGYGVEYGYSTEYLRAEALGRRSPSWAATAWKNTEACHPEPLSLEHWFQVVRLEQGENGFSLVTLQPVVLLDERKVVLPHPQRSARGTRSAFKNFCCKNVDQAKPCHRAIITSGK